MCHDINVVLVFSLKFVFNGRGINDLLFTSFFICVDVRVLYYSSYSGIDFIPAFSAKLAIVVQSLPIRWVVLILKSTCRIRWHFIHMKAISFLSFFLLLRWIPSFCFIKSVWTLKVDMFILIINFVFIFLSLFQLCSCYV